jgi:MFS family permease
VHGTFVALRQRNFRIWMGAGFVSTTGSWMQTLAINWYVLQSTGSATRMGFTLLLQALPVLLLSSWAGALADRLPGRRVLIGTQVAHASLALGLAIVATGHLGILPVYLISLAGGLVNAVEGPAMGRFTSSTVDPATLGNALSLGSLSNSAGRIIGMSLGGLAVAAVGPAPLFVGNAASFLAVIGALLVIRTHDAAPAPEPGSGGVREGLRYLLRQPMVLIALGLAAMLGSLGRNYQVTMAAMSNGPLHSGASGYGLLSTIFAIGTVLGGLAAARRSHLGYRTLVGAGLIASTLQLTLGLVGGVWAFGAVLLPIAAGAVLIDTTVATRVQLDTRVEMRGRVLAALSMTSALASALGGQLLGWLCEAAGPRDALVLAGAVTAIASMAAGVAFAAHRDRPLRPIEVGRTLMAGVRHVPDQRVPRPAGRRPRRLIGPRIAGRSAVHAVPMTRSRGLLSAAFPRRAETPPAALLGPDAARAPLAPPAQP